MIIHCLSLGGHCNTTMGVVNTSSTSGVLWKTNLSFIEFLV